LRHLASVPPADSSPLAWYNNRGDYSLVGTISAPPEIRTDDIRNEIKFSELTDLSSTDALTSTRRISSSALVTLPRWSQWQYGDQLMFFGSPRTSSIFPGFSYKDYLARQGIESVIYYPAEVQKVGEKNGIGVRRWMIAFREHTRILILSLMPQPESGLLNGILLGLENDITPSLKTAFRDTGTSHVIAISGFNMTLIATLLIFSLSWVFPRLWGYWQPFSSSWSTPYPWMALRPSFAPPAWLPPLR
jgi:competence protein ComEC